MGKGFLCDKCDHFDVPDERVEICKKCYASLLNRASAWDSLPKKVKKSVAVDPEEDDIDKVEDEEDNGDEDEDGDEEEEKPRKVVKKKKGKKKRKKGKGLLQRIGDAIW